MVKKPLVALAIVPMAMALSAQTAPATSYTMAMTITDNKVVIAEPSLRVQAGAKSSVRVDKGDGRNYSIAMVFVETDDGLLAMTSQIDAKSPTLGSVSFAPAMKLAEGETAVIEYGSVGPGIEPLRISFSVKSI